MLLAMLSQGPAFVLWLAAPADHISRAHFQRIKIGMTEAEVESIIGPALTNDDVWRVRQSGLGLAEKAPGGWPHIRTGVWPESARRYWLSADHQRAVDIEFSEGRVVTAYYLTTNLEDWRSNLRRWLSW
jgi:hypothetical protein